VVPPFPQGLADHIPQRSEAQVFKLSEIKELIKLIDQSSLQELEIQNENYRLFIKKPGKTESVIVTSAPAPQGYIPAAPQAAPFETNLVIPANAVPQETTATGANDPNLHMIVSPMVGTFYLSPAPDAPPYVSEGSKVTEKTVVCIVEAMKLMNEIEAEIKGEITEVLVDNGQLVEYGQPLFLVKTQ
jgi:acetyl-CoA carboxylase biotin carboxyl carrier protein